MIPTEQSVGWWVLGFTYVGDTCVCIVIVVAAWVAWGYIRERLEMKREELHRAVAEMRQNEHDAFHAISRWRPTGMDLVSEIDQMVNTLQAQSKENERLRAALEKAAEKPCRGDWNARCSFAVPEFSDRWCASCIARAALKETP